LLVLSPANICSFNLKEFVSPKYNNISLRYSNPLNNIHTHLPIQPTFLSLDKYWIMKNTIIYITILLLSWEGFAQIGHQFPLMHAKKLDDHEVVLPQSTHGKFTLIGLAYSKEAETDLATWFQPVYETFIHKDKGGVFEVESYDIHLFFVPMFTGLNQAAHGKAVKEMKASVDKTLWPYILIYKGEVQTYKTQLLMDKKELPYFFVLDKNGKVVYKTSGKYSDHKMEEIEKLLETN